MKKLIIKKKLKPSSKNWLLRHINDPYVAMAKKQGYRSRSSFKILEIEEKYKIFNKTSLVIDLGSAPGGWSQIVSEIVEQVIAIDLLEMPSLPNVNFVCGDFLEQQSLDKITFLMDGKLANVVMSDMAPNTCGIQKIDHIRIMVLLEEVFLFCKLALNESGVMIAKVFQGGATAEFLNEVKKLFQRVYHFKPKSSRKKSTELYLVCIGFKRYLV